MRLSKKNIVLAVLLLIAIGALPAYWTIRAEVVRPEFVEALRSGKVEAIPLPHQAIVWSDADLATVQVTRLEDSFGRERALSRLAYERGQYTISAQQYDFQATATDLETSLQFVSGRRRSGPGAGTWVWTGIHPNSMMQWIEMRDAQVQSGADNPYPPQQ